MTSPKTLVIVGNQKPYHIGAHFLKAADRLGIQSYIIESAQAFDAPLLWTRISWRLFNHRPPRLNRIDKTILETCQEIQPNYLLVTGIPLTRPGTITKIRKLGTKCYNYPTDDPWNPVHRSQRVFKILPEFDHVFTPREANIEDFKQLGCSTTYLPFAYEPTEHFPETPPSEHAGDFACDIMFYGGADRDRLPFITALIEDGYNVHLHGGYWEKHPQTREAAKGHALGEDLRWAVSGAKITLCLVRRGNRDGHVMRTFEAPAMNACMLSEDTPEHRRLLGNDAVFFKDIDEMRTQVQRLLEDDAARQRLRAAMHQFITNNANTYTDRLKAILEHDNDN